MDGLCRVLAGEGVAVIGGRTVLVRPLTLADYAAIEGYLLRQRATPIRQLSRLRGPAAQSQFFQELAKRAVEDAKKDKALRVVQSEELRNWVNTSEGVAFTAWLCLRDRHPDFTSPQNAQQFFERSPDDAIEFVEVRDACSGIDLLASLDFPTPIHPRTGRPIEQHRPKFIPWSDHVKSFATELHWPLSWVASLTLYQLHCLLSESNGGNGGGGTTKLSGSAAARNWEKMGPEEKKAALAKMRAGGG